MNTQYIDFYLQKHKITKEEFAKECNLTTKELQDVYNQKNINIFTAIKIYVSFRKILHQYGKLLSVYYEV